MGQDREYPFENVEEAEEELEELGYTVLDDLEDEDAEDLEAEILDQFEREGRI